MLNTKITISYLNTVKINEKWDILDIHSKQPHFTTKEENYVNTITDKELLSLVELSHVNIRRKENLFYFTCEKTGRPLQKLAIDLIEYKE